MTLSLIGFRSEILIYRNGKTTQTVLKVTIIEMLHEIMPYKFTYLH